MSGIARLSQGPLRDDFERNMATPVSPHRGNPPFWPILVVLVATVFGFAAAMLYSQSVASKLDDDAVSIATNASPAIAHLSAARAELLRVELAASAAIQRSRGGAMLDRTRFDDALSRLHRELAAYVSLPFYPHEKELYTELDEATRKMESTIPPLLAQLEARDTTGALDTWRSRLSPAVAREDVALERIVTFNADQQRRLGTNIPQLRIHAARIGYFLEGLAALLAFSLMGLVVRQQHRSARLVDDRNRLLAAHARDVEMFGAKLESLSVSSAGIFETMTTAPDLRGALRVIADAGRNVLAARACALGCSIDPDHSLDPWVFSGTATDTLDVPSIAVPIRRDGHVVGSLYLAREHGDDAFTDDDRRVTELLAAYVGVAMNNARLYSVALEAVRAREDLVATVSHDLKSPLNTIRLATQLLARCRGGGEPGNELVPRIERAADRMTRLIGDLLDASKIEAGVLRVARQAEDVLPLMEVAMGMFPLAAAEKALVFSVHVSPCPAVLCERDLILRTLSNLIGNAVKFSPAGTAITLAAEERIDEVQFSVIDEGPGIPPEDLAHAFDRYWQQKTSDRRGSGLGLYIAKGIVEAHGGRIWIDSTLGQGTAVHFTLQSSRVAAATRAPAVVTESSAVGPPH